MKSLREGVTLLKMANTDVKSMQNTLNGSTQASFGGITQSAASEIASMNTVDTEAIKVLNQNVD
jgi:hypothetical protein